MTSILTNTSALAALQTLRSIGADLSDTQQRVSTGLRVSDASDNAAYWSIATTMRSDRTAISAVNDALGLGAAKVDTAYAGMSAVADILSEFQAKLVSADEPGVDKAKIQEELDQMKQQVASIAASSSFSGENWLSTDVKELREARTNTASIVDGFIRTPSGGVSVTHNQIHLSDVSLFNSTGDGILDPDLRDVRSIGGMRDWGYWKGGTWVENWSPYNWEVGSRAAFQFDFAGPIQFDDPSDAITFDVTVDKDDPATGVPAPYNPGVTTSIVIDRSVVDAADPSLGGVIATNSDYGRVLNYALRQAHAGASVFANYIMRDPITGLDVHDPVTMSIQTDQDRSLGLDGSYVEISAFSSNVGDGGLGDDATFGTRGSSINLAFESFEVYKEGDDPAGIEIDFSFYINGASPISYSFDRMFVTNTLGKANGKIETADEMVTVLKKLIADDWPTLIIESTSPDNVTLRTDPNMDRLDGSGTRMGFVDMSVSIEPNSKLGFMNLDITSAENSVDNAIGYIEKVSKKVISGAALLGSLQSRIEMQSNFTNLLTDTINRGVGRLVDADMNEESTRLKALQTQQQLATQSLNLANSDAKNVMVLFS